MLDRLIDLIIEFLELFQFFFFVDEFEEGVVLRQGRFHRIVKPGFRWIIPLAQEEVIVVNVKPEPMWLDVQSVHTKDDYGSNIQVGIIWRVTDVKKFLMDNEATEAIVSMLCAGVVWESVKGCKWTEIRESGYTHTLKYPMNRKVRKRGAEIDEVIVQDFASGSANRIWHEGISLNLDE